jgi:hypothetical protein
MFKRRLTGFVGTLSAAKIGALNHPLAIALELPHVP